VIGIAKDYHREGTILFFAVPGNANQFFEVASMGIGKPAEVTVTRSRVVGAMGRAIRRRSLALAGGLDPALQY
jgi:hypothetical protein